MNGKVHLMMVKYIKASRLTPVPYVYNRSRLEISLLLEGRFGLLYDASWTSWYMVCFMFFISLQRRFPLYFAPLVVYYDSLGMNKGTLIESGSNLFNVPFKFFQMGACCKSRDSVSYE